MHNISHTQTDARSWSLGEVCVNSWATSEGQKPKRCSWLWNRITKWKFVFLLTCTGKPMLSHIVNKPLLDSMMNMK